MHPTMDQMVECVVRDNVRPSIEEEWRTDERVGDFCCTIEDSWDDHSEARLTVQCVLERLYYIGRGVHVEGDGSVGKMTTTV